MSITRETGIEGPRERYSLRSSLNTECASPARAGAHRGQERSAQEAGGGWVPRLDGTRRRGSNSEIRRREPADEDSSVARSPSGGAARGEGSQKGRDHHSRHGEGKTPGGEGKPRGQRQSHQPGEEG